MNLKSEWFLQYVILCPICPNFIVYKIYSLEYWKFNVKVFFVGMTSHFNSASLPQCHFLLSLLPSEWVVYFLNESYRESNKIQ